MDLETILAELGYTRDWLAVGVVDETFLREQYAEFCRSEDKNQEHYRNGAFVSFLHRIASLSGEELSTLLNLTDNGPDRCDLAIERAIELLASGILTDEQLFGLAERHPRVLTPPLRKRYLREVLMRRIRRTGLEANFSEVQGLLDSTVQREILDHSELTRAQLEWLASHGLNKAIRNRATELLQCRRFR